MTKVNICIVCKNSVYTVYVSHGLGWLQEIYFTVEMHERELYNVFGIGRGISHL